MYEEQCKAETTWNSSISCHRVYKKKTSITSDKNKPKHSNCEGSESEYDPQQDHTAEEDFFDANTAKARKRTVDMPPGGIKPRPAKRVLAEQATTRCTRSKKSLTLQNGDASSGMSDPKRLTPSDMPVPTSSLPHTSHGEEIIANIDEHTLPDVEDDGLHQPDDNTHVSNESDGITQPDEHNQMVRNEGNGTAQHDEQTQIDSDSEGGDGRCNRGVNMGKRSPKVVSSSAWQTANHHS